MNKRNGFTIADALLAIGLLGGLTVLIGPSALQFAKDWRTMGLPSPEIEPQIVTARTVDTTPMEPARYELPQPTQVAPKRVARSAGPATVESKPKPAPKANQQVQENVVDSKPQVAATEPVGSTPVDQDEPMQAERVQEMVALNLTEEVADQLVGLGKDLAPAAPPTPVTPSPAAPVRVEVRFGGPVPEELRKLKATGPAGRTGFGPGEGVRYFRIHPRALEALRRETLQAQRAEEQTRRALELVEREIARSALSARG